MGGGGGGGREPRFKESGIVKQKNTIMYFWAPSSMAMLHKATCLATNWQLKLQVKETS